MKHSSADEPAMHQPLHRVAVVHSVRARLLWLAAAVAVPLTLLAALRAWERSRDETARVTEQAHQLAVVAARGLNAQVSGTRTMLQGLAQLLDPQDAPVKNDAILRRLFREAPARYATIWINDSAGNNVGTAGLPAAGRSAVNLADRQYFKEATQLRRFSAGQVVHSRTLPGAPFVMVFALPVVDSASGVVRAVVGASVQVDSLEGMQVMRTLPPGSVLTILDSMGVVLWRSVDAEHWLGRSYAGTPGVEHNNRVLEGAGPVLSDDGTRRLVSWRHVNSTGWTVYVGIPAQYSLDLAESQFLRDLGWSVVMTVFVLILAYAAARRLVAPIESLTVDAVAIADGDEARRSRIATRDEIGALASAFNRMADTAVARRQELADSERRYRVLFDANPLPLFAWSAHTGNIIDANDAALTQFGYTREAFIGRSLLSLVHASEYDEINLLLARAPRLRNGERWWSVRRMLRADGTGLELEVHAAAHLRSHEIEIVVVAIDVGARNAAAQALNESRELLRQSQKMEALGSFAGGMAHEFNNFLSSIIGFTELAEAALPEESDARADLREALQAATRAAALTRQILVFSRKQVVEGDWLDPSDVVCSLERMLHTLLGESISLVLHAPAGVGLVRTDRGQLEQILVNLARNARDAMPTGGTFTLSTEQLSLREDVAAHPGVPEGEWVMLCARDSGHGIPEHVLSRIFEPFFTTKDRARGTGLGLALVYSMVQHAHGYLRVESDESNGTAFFLYFPRGEPVEGQTLPVEEPKAVRGGGERILVVEDDATVRTVARQVLERAGYLVAEAGDASGALQQLGDGELQFDLMLSDVVMPGMNGPALAQRAQQRHPRLQVLFMSGYPDDDMLLRDTRADAAAFVAKPFSAETLLRKVREMLDTQVHAVLSDVHAG